MRTCTGFKKTVPWGKNWNTALCGVLRSARVGAPLASAHTAMASTWRSAPGGTMARAPLSPITVPPSGPRQVVNALATQADPATGAPAPLPPPQAVKPRLSADTHTPPRSRTGSGVGAGGWRKGRFTNFKRRGSGGSGA